MKKAAVAIVLVTCLAFSAMAQAPKSSAKSDSSTLEAAIHKAWDSFKNQNKDAYAALLTEDTTQVWADNKPPRNKATAVKDMSSLKLDSYALSHMKITMLGPDAALATYQAKVSFMADGKKVSPTLAVSDVWVKRGGEWKDLSYQESEIK